MQRDVLNRILKGLTPEVVKLPSVPRPNINTEPDIAKIRLHGTTIIAFKYKDGVLFAADRRVSHDYAIISQKYLKISLTGRFGMIGSSGSMADAQYAADMLRSVARDFEEKYENPLSISGQANWLSNFYRNHMTYLWPLSVESIIGGLSLGGESSIFSVYTDGGLLKDDFFTTGSGGDRALSILDENEKALKAKSLEFEPAVKLAVKAILFAGHRDSGTADKSVLPDIAVISETGCLYLEENFVEKICQEVKNEQT